MADVMIKSFKVRIRHDPNTSMINGYYTYRGQLCVIDYAGVKHYERGYVGPWELCLKWAIQTVERVKKSL